MITLYPRKSIFIGILLAFSGCGGEISRINGLPETMDTSGVPWPQLVDVPDAPTEGLEAGKGRALLAELNAEGAQVSERRAASPVPLETTVLEARAAEVDARRALPVARVDTQALTERGARLSQMRGAEAVASVDTDALRQRAALTRNAGRQDQDVNTSDLLQRAARIREAGRYGQQVDKAALQQRAAITRNAGRYGQQIDTLELQQRAAVTRNAGINRPAVDTLDLEGRAQRGQVSAAVPRTKPATASRPAVPRKAPDTPVLGQDFLARAKAAQERARKAAQARE